MKKNFYIFRSNIQHKIKNNEKQFIVDTIENDEINKLFSENNILECLYLLSCIDTLCLKYNYPLCEDYNKYRKIKFEEPIFISTINKKIQNEKKYLPEFLKHNIYEITIYDAK